jgi:DNA-binding NarL/FixJ family response regulator
MRSPRVLLADDHAIVAEGLRLILEGDCQLVGTVMDGRALVQTALELRPDVIVSDISMPLLNGLDAVRQIRRANPVVKILILTMHWDAQLAAEAFRAGANGYLLKQSAGEELIAAIREVLTGRTYITPLIARDLMAVFLDAKTDPDGPRGSGVTPRQREVLQLVAEGKTMKEIARILGVSTRTAESHKYEMMQQLGIETTAELVRYAVKIGLVPVETV